MRRVRGYALILAAVFSLAGCAPGGSAPGPNASPPVVEPSASPSVSPTAAALVLPGSCDDLVPIAWIKSNFSESFEAIPLDVTIGDSIVADFAARGGLTCWWGVPNSDVGMTLFVAERATPTDAAQVAEWEAAGYQRGPDFLDACWLEYIDSDWESLVNVHALAEGYELRSQGLGVQADPYLSLIRQASDGMGYR